jgi:anti-sigma regulatory factor (Ser/Thr protein kinase)
LKAKARSGVATSQAWRFAATPDIGAQMRRILERFCSERGVAPGLLTDIKLAVTEAATNAVRHAYVDRPGPVMLRASLEGSDLLIEVLDQGRGCPPILAVPDSA